MNQPLNRNRNLFLPVAILALIVFNLACGLGSRFTKSDPTQPAAYQTFIASQPDTPTPSPTITQPPPDATAVIPDNGALPIETVVQIWTLDEFGEQLWSGSGTFISEQGYILTNAHVVLPDKYYDVYGLMVSLTVDDDQPPQPAYRAETVAFDETLDLAVIRIISDLQGNPLNYAELNLPVIQLGNSDDLGLGTPLRILGYPGIGGETITLTSGEVAGFTSETGVKGRAYIKTSATIAGGNSGGAGINLLGQLIGVPTQLGYGGDDEIVDCRVLADTNGDGTINDRDACVPTGGFINALRPINLAKPLIAQALTGETLAQATPSAAEPERSPVGLPENAGEVLHEDNFSADTGSWGIIDGIALDDERLSLYIETAGDYIWSTTGGDYADIDYQIETIKLGGPTDNSYGQIFRFQDKDNFYTFEISSDGFYIVNKLQEGTWTPLIDWTASSIINTDSGLNQIATVAQGNTFTFFINGVQVDSLTDNAFAQGNIGVIASSYAEPGVYIGFDNLLARVPGGIRTPLLVEPETPTDSVLVFADDFSQSDPGWNLESNETVLRSIEDGEFSLTIVDDQTDGWATHNISLSDAIIEVSARKVAGPNENNYGVMCRYVDPDNHYFLQLGSDGTYAITRYVQGELTMLVDWTSSEAVHQNNETNLIRAECVGDTLSLYANNVLLGSVVDGALKYGRFALAAGTYDEGNVQIKFDDLTVRGSQTEGSGETLFFDDFKTNSADWPEQSDAEAEYRFSDGEYIINVLSSDYLVWARTNDNWNNIKAELDIRQVSGPDDNEFGLMCRYQDVDNYYQLGLSGDGYFRIARWLEGEFEELVPWEKNSAINQGDNVINHIAIVCDGNRLALWANGTLLADIDDNALPPIGDVALYVGTFDEGEAKIAFDNLEISRP